MENAERDLRFAFCCRSFSHWHRALFKCSRGRPRCRISRVRPSSPGPVRSTFDEIPTVLFFLAGLYALIRYLKGSAGYLPLAGLFFGLAVSMKWYFVISLAAVTLFALLATAQRDGRRWLRVADIVSACIIIPVTIYLIVFIRWFDRGYGIWEFIQMQFDAYREFQFVQAANVNPALAERACPGSGSYGRC